MDRPLPNLLELLRQATGPEQVFGDLQGNCRMALKRRYHELASIAHPDHNPVRQAEANAAFQALQTWYAEARQHLDQGTYGRAARIRAVTKLHCYVGYEPPLGGDLCDLYPAAVGGEQVLLKVARCARNNDLLAAEARSLALLGHELGCDSLRAHFPTLIEHFLLAGADGSPRQVNVLSAEAGYVSLEEVLRAYPQGIDAADAAWMFNRMLAALGTAHRLGRVHGATLPSHVLIRPADHNGMLLDWCYSVATGEPLKAISLPYASEYPPEVGNRQPATSATDLYMAARCMVRLLGGHGATADLPPGVPKPIAALLRACLLPSPYRRPADAWQLFDDFQEILERLYGPRRFRPFQIVSPA